MMISQQRLRSFFGGWVDRDVAQYFDRFCLESKVLVFTLIIVNRTISINPAAYIGQARVALGLVSFLYFNFRGGALIQN